jgi:hypothetical protein
MVTIAQAGDEDDRTLRTAVQIIAVLAEAARERKDGNQMWVAPAQGDHCRSKWRFGVAA